MKRGFTLIELLIVIAIVAVLAIAIVIILNPTELLKQARDSTRLSDLDNLNKAIALFSAQDSAGPIGDSDKIYVSLPDTDNQDPAECDEYTTTNLLPLPPATFSYVCKKIDDYRKINGDGWIPIDFRTLAAGPPLSILPVDPVNTVANGLYFTYVRGGSWKLTALFESQKKAKVMASDGGPDVGIYEVGTNLNLVNGIRGLTGYWKFDEGSGTTANDSSGNNPVANLGSGVTWVSNGQVNGAANFNGTFNAFISVTGSPALNKFITAANGTMAAWIKPTGLPLNSGEAYDLPPVIGDAGGYTGITRGKIPNASGNDRIWFFNYENLSTGVTLQTDYTVDQWIHLAWVHGGGLLYLYKNGQLVASALSGNTDSTNGMNGVFIIGGPLGSRNFTGVIDETRTYNRALSASEIQALYNATKP